MYAHGTAVFSEVSASYKHNLVKITERTGSEEQARTAHRRAQLKLNPSRLKKTRTIYCT